MAGELDKGLAERKRMQELDPVSPFAAVNVGWSYFYKRDYDAAIEQYRKALELDPNYGLAQEALGGAYLHKGMRREAVEAFLRRKAISGAAPEVIAEFRRAYAAGGIKGYWRKELERAQQQEEGLRRGQASPSRLARTYAELGDKDRAFEWLEKAYAERSSALIFLGTDPTFDSLRDDPRFQELWRRIRGT